MRRAILTLAVACALSGATGCGSRPDPFAVGMDLHHGGIWPGFTNQLATLGLTARVVGSAEDLRRLDDLRVLVLVIGEDGAGGEFSEEDADRVERFVGRGGGLLCAGSAASWVVSGRGTAESFPLNVLGRRLGFEVLNRTVMPPRNLSPVLSGGVGAVNRSHWWASEIRASAKSSEAMVTDEAMRPMAIALTHGRGRVIVAGHPDLLRENPDIVRNALLRLLGIEQDQL